MGERVADYIRTHTPEEVNEYVMGLRERVNENYVMDNDDVLAFRGLSYLDTCLLSIFVTNTGVDTSGISAVLTTFVRQVNKRRYIYETARDEPNYSRHLAMRGDYMSTLDTIREFGLADILTFGRYHTRESLDMIKNVLNRLWFYQGLRDYTLTIDDINALERCTQASAVYSFEPIDFLSLTIVDNHVTILDEVRQPLRELRAYTQRIQVANNVPDSVRLVINDRRTIRSECASDDYLQVHAWINDIRDGIVPEDLLIVPIVRLRPDLLAQLITSDLLIFGGELSQEDWDGIYQAWNDCLQDVHLISPKLLHLAGVEDLPNDVNEAYIRCLTLSREDVNDEYVLQADDVIRLMRDLPLPPVLLDRVRAEADSEYEPTVERVEESEDRVESR